MSSRYLRKTAAQASPIYEKIVTAAMGHLTRNGTFRKEDIVDELQLNGFEDSIRWDYVREFLQDQRHAGADLIPVAESFFSHRISVDGVMERNTPQLQQRVPERFIAMGHGKKTAGYVLVEPRNGHLVLIVAKLKDARATGVRKSADKFRDDAQQRNAMGRLPPHPPRSLPPTG